MSGAQLVVVVIVSRILARPCRVFGMGLQAMAAIPDYKELYLKVFQDLVLVVLRCDISPEVPKM